MNLAPKCCLLVANFNLVMFESGALRYAVFWWVMMGLQSQEVGKIFTRNSRDVGSNFRRGDS